MWALLTEKAICKSGRGSSWKNGICQNLDLGPLRFQNCNKGLLLKPPILQYFVLVAHGDKTMSNLGWRIIQSQVHLVFWLISMFSMILKQFSLRVPSSWVYLHCFQNQATSLLLVSPLASHCSDCISYHLVSFADTGKSPVCSERQCDFERSV